MTSLEVFRLFLLREKGQKSSTVHNNQKLINKILRECDPLTMGTVTDLINKSIDEGRDVGYINQHIILIRYYAECFDLKELKEYPYCKLKKRDDFVRATFSDEEVDAFLNLPNPFKKSYKYSKYWNRYNMWSLYWRINAFEGFRTGETIKLQRSHVDFGRNVFILPDTKTGHRLVPMSFAIRDNLLEYLKDPAIDYLFPPLHKSKSPHMGQSAWLDDFENRIKRLNEIYPGIIDRPNLNPYSMRHTFGTRQADQDRSIAKIQKAMGHRKLSTTEKYLHMSLKGVTEMFDQDRLALRYKMGADIARQLVDAFCNGIRLFSGKIMLTSLKISKDGRKYSIEIEVID